MKNLKLSVFVMVALLTTACVEKSQRFEYPESLYGRYKLVSLRADSHTASTPAMMGSDNPIGTYLEIDEYGFHMAGFTCQTGSIQEIANSFVFLDDPNLADLNVRPLSDPGFRGEQRLHQAYEVVCDGVVLTQLHQVDDQILVMPWANSSQYLIMEKPLSEEQIRTFQSQLRDMKFLSQEPNGLLDEETLLSIGHYTSYRLEDKEAPRFLRTAISENLLDGLGILNDD